MAQIGTARHAYMQHTASIRPTEDALHSMTCSLRPASGQAHGTDRHRASPDDFASADNRAVRTCPFDINPRTAIEGQAGIAC